MTNHANSLAVRDTATVPIASVGNVLAAAPRVGAHELCDAVGLEPALLGDPVARIPIAQLAEMYEVAARLTRDPWFGLHVGAAIEHRNYGLLGYIALNSATLGDALACLVRYLPLWTAGATLELQRSSTTARLAWDYVDRALTETRHDCEMTVMAAAGIGRLLHDDVWRPREVHFRHTRPRDASEHRRLMRAPVHFGMAANQIVFDPSALAAPIRGADRKLGDVLIGHAEQLLASVPPRSLVDAATVAIRRALPSGDLQIARIASALGASPRTLQRRLVEHGTSFRDLVARVRRECAQHYLEHTQAPISEIATRLGYRHPTEIHRAFRSWTGTTPVAYRRARRR